MKRLLFLSICFSSAFYYEAQAMSQLREPQYHKLIAQHCDRLTSFLQNIAQRLRANTLQTKYKNDYQPWLMQLSLLIKTVKEANPAGKSVEQYQKTLDLHSTITTMVLDVVEKNLKIAPPALKKPASSDKKISLPETIAQNIKQMQKLELAMETLGLTAINRAWRAFYTKIMQVQHENPKTCATIKYGTATVAAGAAFYGLHKLLNQNKQSRPTSAQLQTRDVSIYDEALRNQGLRTARITAQEELTRKRKNIQLINDVALSQNPIGIFSAFHRYHPTEIGRTALTAYALKEAGSAVYKILNDLGLPKKANQVQKYISNYLWGNTQKVLKTSTEDEESKYPSLDHPFFNGLPQTPALLEIANNLANANVLAAANVEWSKAILLSGNPGCGKTFSAQALGETVRQRNKKGGIPIKFLDLSGPVGHLNSSQIIAAIHKYIVQASPCILFIDELHLIGGGLKVGGNADLLRSILTLIDEVNKSKDQRHQVVLLAASSRLDDLDEPLFRSGRFQIIHFRAPNFNQRKSFLNALCKENAVTPQQTIIESVAQATQGCTHSDLNVLFHKAREKGLQLGKSIDDCLYDSLNTVIRKLRPALYLSADESHTIASYQAGKALMHMKVEPLAILESVTTQAYTHMHSKKNDDAQENYTLQHGAIFAYPLDEAIKATNDEEKIKHCKILLAGSIAQEILTGKRLDTNDNKQAYQMLLDMQTQGISLDSLSDDDQQAMKKKALTQLKQYQQEVRNYLTKEKAALAALTDALQAKTFLTRPEIEAAIQKTAAQTA